MDQKSGPISLSFSPDELLLIEERATALKLPARGGRSQYFQMLLDYEAHFHLTPHYHKADGKLHFYPEEGAYTQAADGRPDPAVTAAAADALRRAEREAESRTPKPSPKAH